MELRHLRYFVAVAEELNFGRAAQRLQMSQPPLSQQIKRLERELDVRLFDRTNRRVNLTSAGETLLAESYELLARADSAVQATRASVGGVVGNLTIGCTSSGFADALTRTIRRFHGQFPEVRLDVREMYSFAQIDALRSRRIDLGIVRGRVLMPQIESSILRSEPLCVALPADHPLADQREVDLAELADESFLMVGRRAGQWYFEIIVKACRRAGFSPRIVQECDSVLSELALIGGGLGAALVPDSIANLGVPGVTVCHLRGRQTFVPLQAIWLKGSPSRTREHFIDSAHEVLPK